MKKVDWGEKLKQLTNEFDNYKFSPIQKHRIKVNWKNIVFNRRNYEKSTNKT